jgi:hypothetical protein
MRDARGHVARCERFRARFAVESGRDQLLTLTRMAGRAPLSGVEDSKMDVLE